MRLLIFTCERDWAKAALAVRTVPPAWSVAYVVESKDAAMVPPAGVDIITADFPRGGNLSGSKATIGVVGIIAQEADKFGRVGKLDSDTLLVEGEWMMAGDVAGMAHQAACLSVYGCAYAVSQRAARRAAGWLKGALAKGCRLDAEDVCVTGAANGWADTRLPIGSFWESKHDGKLPGRAVRAIHCGNVNCAPREGGKVAQEMRRLGDALGLWRR